MHIVDEPRKFSPSNVLTYTVINLPVGWWFLIEHELLLLAVCVLQTVNGYSGQLSWLSYEFLCLLVTRKIERGKNNGRLTRVNSSCAIGRRG